MSYVTNVVLYVDWLDKAWIDTLRQGYTDGFRLVNFNVIDDSGFDGSKGFTGVLLAGGFNQLDAEGLEAWLTMELPRACWVLTIHPAECRPTIIEHEGDMGWWNPPWRDKDETPYPHVWRNSE